MKQTIKLNKALNKLEKGFLSSIAIGNPSKPYSNIEGTGLEYNPYFEIFYNKEKEGFKVHPDNMYLPLNEIHRRFNESNMEVLGTVK